MMMILVYEVLFETSNWCPSQRIRNQTARQDNPIH